MNFRRFLSDGRRAKVLFEKWWLAPPGWKREFYATLLKTAEKPTEFQSRSRT